MKPKHYLGLALLLPAPAFAATETDDVIAGCARISSTGDRILCLEDALRRLSSPADSVVVREVDDSILEMDSTEQSSVIPADSSMDAMTEPGMAESASAATTAASMAGEPAAVAEAEVAAEAAPIMTSDELQPELGAEQVARQNNVEEEQVRISAAIVEHTLIGTGRLRLTLDNGQVWQQTGDDDDRIARRIRGQANIAIEMWQSRSGGYRMHLLEIDRTLRVRRIR